MSKSIKKFVAFVLVLQMLMPYPVYAAAVGRFTSVVGNVIQTRAGKAIKPVVNSPIDAKDIIATGNKSSATMVFVDDSTIALSQNSRMEVKDFAVKGKTRKGIFSMSIGKLVANVTKFIGGSNAFEVHSPTAVCGVRGTGFEFIVAGVGAQLTTTVTCTTGALSVSSITAAGVVTSAATIVAGQTAIITSTGITISAAGAVAGAGTVSTGAAGAGAGGAGTAGAGAAGAAAGTATVAGVGAGTIAAATAVVAVGAAAVVAATGSKSDTTPVHVTPVHH
ncbi:MAG: FecR domain-containing protein [Smithella sp.]